MAQGYKSTRRHSKKLKGCSKLPLQPYTPYHYERGFTLIEAVVYFAIFAIIAVLGISVLSFSLGSRNVVQEKTEVTTQAQRAVEYMVEKVRTSTSVSASTTASQLWLNRSLGSENPTVFSLVTSTNALNIQEGAGSAVAVTPSTIAITALTFTKADNPTPATSSIKMVMTAAYVLNGQIVTSTAYTLQTTATPLQ